MFATILLFAQEKGAPDGAPIWASFVPLLLIFLLFYLFLILPAQRRERRQREELFNKLKKNDRVLTSAGIFGVVANIKGEEVTLRIDDTSNARLQVLRSTIVRILTAEDAAKDATGKAGQGAETSVKAGAPPSG
jgi:preprotein translocase subunit YajC